MCFAATRLLPVLLLLADVAAPGGDETHPRAPDHPLPIELGPWFCNVCLKQKLIEGEPRAMELLGYRPGRLFEMIGLKRDPVIIESPHYRIVCTMKGARIRNTDSRFALSDLERLTRIFPAFKRGSQGGYVNSHQRAHLYHVRLERIYAHFSALTANKAANLGMGARIEAYLFEKEEHYRALTEKVLGRAHNPRTWVARKYIVAGEKSYYAITTAAELFKKGDRATNNTVLHHLGHVLANGHRGFVRDVWAFLEAGFAHYYERRESDQHNWFCLVGQDPPSDFVRGNWRKKIRHMVYRKKDPSLGNWCETLHAQQLGGREHALAWSIVEWLVKTDPVRLTKLMDRTNDKQKNPTAAEAIEDVFGVSPYVLHERWRKYVLREYK